MSGRSTFHLSVHVYTSSGSPGISRVSVEVERDSDKLVQSYNSFDNVDWSEKKFIRRSKTFLLALL